MTNNQTVQNMKLIIFEMDKQSKSTHYAALKTLSNSYQTLLDQLYSNTEDISSIEDMNELEYQQKKLQDLKIHLESQSIPELLSAEDYISVNHITTTTTKLGACISNTNRLLIRYIYPKHRTHIGIFSQDIGSASQMMDTLINMSGEEILEERSHLLKEKVINTKNVSYTAREYNDNYRGKRFDKVYVDRKLDSEKISIISLMAKDSDNVKYF